MSGAIDSLPPLRDVIAAHDLRAEKSLGQNFLLDQNLTDKIARQADDISDHHIFEIGPGPGGLTRSLLRAGAKKVTAIEFDRRAIAALESLREASDGRLEILHADALEVDITAMSDGPRMVAANLPYNIATPLLIGWLKQIREDTSHIDKMILMFQKEVAERIAAQPNSKAYGRLSVISQWLCGVRKAFDLPPSAFTPPPKVTSSVVIFTPKDLEAGAPSFEAVETITAAAFGQRRKMLRSSLKSHADVLEASGIDGQLRAENLRPEDFVRLAQFLT